MKKAKSIFNANQIGMLKTNWVLKSAPSLAILKVNTKADKEIG